MADIFAASEIVELGIQIEINGRDYYSLLAGKVKDKNVKDVFKFLAKAEEKHIKKFKKILKSFHKYEPKEAYPQEYFSYMNSLASGHVFTKSNKGKEIAERCKNEKEAIDIGIQAEKDSIIFYEGMKKITPEKEKKIIDKVISEEEKHLEKLFGLTQHL